MINGAAKWPPALDGNFIPADPPPCTRLFSSWRPESWVLDEIQSSCPVFAFRIDASENATNVPNRWCDLAAKSGWNRASVDAIKRCSESERSWCLQRVEGGASTIKRSSERMLGNDLAGVHSRTELGVGLLFVRAGLRIHFDYFFE